MRIFFVFLFAFTTFSYCQSKKSEEQVLQKDLKYIGCDVCEKSVGELFDAVQEEREKTPKNRKIEEIRLIELMDAICNPTSGSGEWIKRIDITKIDKGNKNFRLALVEPGGISKCGSECLTIAKSCENLLDDDIDRDELLSLLWKNKSTKTDLVNKVCKSMSSRCKKVITLPKDYTRQDQPFKAQSEKEIQMEKLMATMRESGVGGSLYGREDMDDLMEMYGGDGEEDREDSSRLPTEENDDKDDFDSQDDNTRGANIEF